MTDISPKTLATIEDTTKRAGLGISSLAYYDNNLDADENKRAFNNRHLLRCIDYAALLGVPTISMGVPTVMDAGELCKSRHRLVVTPKEIDYLITRAAGVLSLAINKALQQELSVGELDFLTS